MFVIEYYGLITCYTSHKFIFLKKDMEEQPVEENMSQCSVGSSNVSAPDFEVVDTVGKNYKYTCYTVCIDDMIYNIDIMFNKFCK